MDSIIMAVIIISIALLVTIWLIVKSIFIHKENMKDYQLEEMKLQLELAQNAMKHENKEE